MGWVVYVEDSVGWPAGATMWLMADARPIVSIEIWEAEAALIGAIYSDVASGRPGPDFWPAMTAYVAALGKEQGRFATPAEARLNLRSLLETAEACARRPSAGT